MRLRTQKYGGPVAGVTLSQTACSCPYSAVQCPDGNWLLAANGAQVEKGDGAAVERALCG